MIVNDGYLGDPQRVLLMPGAAQAVARVRALGFATVVVSNQSGVGRGMFSEDDVRAVKRSKRGRSGCVATLTKFGACSVARVPSTCYIMQDAQLQVAMDGDAVGT